MRFIMIVVVVMTTKKVDEDCNISYGREEMVVIVNEDESQGETPLYDQFSK